MRTVLARQHGESAQVTQIVLPGIVEPRALQVRRLPRPTPAVGQVLVRMEATGVSNAEVRMRRGIERDQPAFPFVPGFDVVGRVIEVGPSVSPNLIGRRYAAVVRTGGWASHLVIPADLLVPVPEELDAAAVETVLSHGVVAWQMLHRVAAVRPGGIIVVMAADGGIGGSLVQLGRRAGLTVIAIAPPFDQESLRQQGALAVNCWAPDLCEQLRGYAPDGVDAVFNHIGEETLAQSWEGLRRGGTLVLYSSLSISNDDPRLGPSAKDAARLRLWNLLPNGRRAQSFNLPSGQFRSRRRRQQWWREDTGKVLQLLAENVLTPRIAARFPLSEADLALTLAESPDLRGKVVIVPDA